MKRVSLGALLVLVAVGTGIFFLGTFIWERQQLLKIIERLTAESRIAEVLVTDVTTDPRTNTTYTTIKFLEYDARQRPLGPQYFTFRGSIIQIQSLVIRFDDFYIKGGHPLKGKSAYLFMKAFSLDEPTPQIFEINKIREVPSGYEAAGVNNNFQKRMWRKFWEYALNPQEAKRMGVKNAQLEAPGTKFIKGMLYTVKIEHDGGMRIDAQPLPRILRGERIDF